MSQLCNHFHGWHLFEEVEKNPWIWKAAVCRKKPEVLQRLNLPIFLTIAGGLGVGQAWIPFFFDCWLDVVLLNFKEVMIYWNRNLGNSTLVQRIIYIIHVYHTPTSQKKHFMPNKCPYFQGSFCSAISSFFRALLQADHRNQAIKASGLANAWAKMVVSAGHYLAMGHPIGVLMALSFITSLLANLMSHTATAALMAPIAMKVCAAESMKLVFLDRIFL